jgi:urease accessory protein
MFMRIFRSIPLAAGLALAATAPAAAHHVMGGRTPDTAMAGLLSGFGHPIIGLDHLAALVAIGCLAALHSAGPLLVLGYVVAIVLGVGAHLASVTVPGPEVLVAVSVIALGAVIVWRSNIGGATALALFAVVGVLHGYALGESIVGAEATPLATYLIGLTVIQGAIGLGVMVVSRMLLDPVTGEFASVRLLGAGVMGVGLAMLAAQAGAGA